MRHNKTMRANKIKKKILSKVLNRWVKYLLSLKPLIKFILVSFLTVFILGIGAELYAQSTNTRIPIPNLSFNVNEAKNPKETSLSLMILFLVTILSLAPAIIMSVTSFTKIVIVMDFVRRALAVQNLPPNQVMVGLAIFMTFFVVNRACP